MKRIISIMLLLSLCLLTACAAPKKGAATTEELAKRYLDAIIKEDFEAVLSLLPDEVIEYGTKQLDGDRKAVVDFVKYAAYDYYWLAKLPSNVDYSFEMTVEPAGMPALALSSKESILFEEDGVKLYVQDAAVIDLLIETGTEEPVSGSLFAFKIENRWYLISVAGDDELFTY